MALSLFDDKEFPPSPDELATALGPVAPLWVQLVTAVAEVHAPITEDWHCAGAKFGWSLRLRRKDRVVLYLIPQANHFLVGVVLGAKAVAAARAAGIPAPVQEMIDAAKPYAEGRGIRLPVASAADIDTVLKLAAAKMGT